MGRALGIIGTTLAGGVVGLYAGTWHGERTGGGDLFGFGALVSGMIGAMIGLLTGLVGGLVLFL